MPRAVISGRKDDLVVGAFAVITAALVIWQAVEFVPFFDTPRRAFYIIAALALLADLQPFRIGEGSFAPGYIFVSICFTFALLLLVGLAPALSVQFVASVIATTRLRLPIRDAIVVIGRLLFALTAASGVLDLIGPTPFRLGVSIGPGFLVFVIGPALAWFATNYLILILAARLRGGFGWRDLFARTFGYELLATSALLFLAPVFVGSPQGYVFGLLLIPVFALTQISRLLGRQSRGLRQDSLTGALNVRGVLIEYERLVRRRDAYGEQTVGLAVVGIEQAAEVREVFGRRIGNQMLTSARERVSEATGGDGVVGRIFGDELIVLTSGRDVLPVAHRISQAMVAPEYIDDLPFRLTGPIGVSVGGGDPPDLSSLVRNADEAARAARRSGLPVEVYEPRVSGETAQRMVLLKDLSRALLEPLRRPEIAMTYQPQVELDTGAFIGAEALLRWTNPTRGVVNPERLIEVVEPTVLMHALTTRVIDDVVAQLAAWRQHGLRIRVAINISVRDLLIDSFVDRVITVVSEAGLPPEQIELEITEGALVRDEARITRAVSQLAEAGIAVSVDDFGTGYSSLLYLRSLAVSELKIDRGLVQRITEDPNDRTIVRTIIEMGQALGLRVVAEGVEDQATHDLLVELQCPVGQGFLYSRPLEPHAVPGWLGRAHGG